jgi:cyanophycinase-like exopeptidase
VIKILFSVVNIDRNSEFTSANPIKNFQMHRKGRLLLLLSQLFTLAHAQTYTSFFTGDTTDVQTTTQGVVCLMGGRSENDDAMKWWLQRAGGGDVVVLRTTGGNGYNNYLYSELGIPVNSVETLVLPNRAAAQDPYVAQQVRNAEAIWIAGGDQSTYLNNWRGTPLHDALVHVAQIKKIPIGGTSAGMAVLGQYYYGAFGSSATSATVLANPMHPSVTLGGRDFLNLDYLWNTITDTHFDNPDRKGRLVTFMARLAVDSGIRPLAIACDEYTAVCIDTNGLARVFGEFPAYDDNAYFLQANCIAPWLPDTLSNGQPLVWNRNGAALKVYQVKGTLNGSHAFDLTDWKSGSGGNWHNWHVTGSQLIETSTMILPDCALAAGLHQLSLRPQRLQVYPNPCHPSCQLAGYEGEVTLRNMQGQVVLRTWVDLENDLKLPYAGLFIAHTQDGKWVKVMK